MKKIIILLCALFAVNLFGDGLKLPPVLTPDKNISDSLPEGKFVRSGLTIQIAILLDSSNSMDGLIRQAKEQIWNIVNEVSRANKDNQDITMQIALYEYGKSTLPVETGYIQMLSPLTSDLDFLSEKLFSLKTRGGLEYAGEVINKATKNLYWSSHKDDLRIIIIAGNEGFYQGYIDYKKAIVDASKKGIIVNTIFCGPYQIGVSSGWKNGAQIGGGKYMNIDSDMRVVHIPTPYDDRIIILNTQLKLSYRLMEGKIVYYGNDGSKHRMTLHSSSPSSWVIMEEEDMDGDDKQFGFGTAVKNVYKLQQFVNVSPSASSFNEEYNKLYMQIYGRLDTRIASRRDYIEEINKFIHTASLLLIKNINLI